MDKRACESVLGGQTRCQTHIHQTHEGAMREGACVLGGGEFIESTFGTTAVTLLTLHYTAH